MAYKNPPPAMKRESERTEMTKGTSSSTPIVRKEVVKTPYDSGLEQFKKIGDILAERGKEVGYVQPDLTKNITYSGGGSGTPSGDLLYQMEQAEKAKELISKQVISTPQGTRTDITPTPTPQTQQPQSEIVKYDPAKNAQLQAEAERRRFELFTVAQDTTRPSGERLQSNIGTILEREIANPVSNVILGEETLYSSEDVKDIRTAIRGGVSGLAAPIEIGATVEQAIFSPSDFSSGLSQIFTNKEQGIRFASGSLALSLLPIAKISRAPKITYSIELGETFKQFGVQKTSSVLVTTVGERPYLTYARTAGRAETGTGGLALGEYSKGVGTYTQINELPATRVKTATTLFFKEAGGEGIITQAAAKGEAIAFGSAKQFYGFGKDVLQVAQERGKKTTEFVSAFAGKEIGKFIATSSQYAETGISNIRGNVESLIYKRTAARQTKTPPSSGTLTTAEKVKTIKTDVAEIAQRTQEATTAKGFTQKEINKIKVERPATRYTVQTTPATTAKQETKQILAPQQRTVFSQAQVSQQSPVLATDLIGEAAQKEVQTSGLRYGVGTRPAQETGLKPIAGLLGGQKQEQQQALMPQQRLIVQPSLRPPIRPVITTPRTGRPIVAAPSGGGTNIRFGFRRPFIRPVQSRAYRPSLAGIEFKFEAPKQPKILTGFGFRPVVGRKKKRKKKR